MYNEEFKFKIKNKLSFLQIGYWKENENNSIQIFRNYDSRIINNTLKRNLKILTKLVKKIKRKKNHF